MTNLSLINPFETKQSLGNLFPIFTGCGTVIVGLNTLLSGMSNTVASQAGNAQSQVALGLGLCFIFLGLSLILSVFEWRLTAAVTAGMVILATGVLVFFAGGKWLALSLDLFSDRKLSPDSSGLLLAISPLVCLFFCGVVIAVLNFHARSRKILILITLVMALAMMGMVSRLLIGSIQTAGHGLLVMDQVHAILFFCLGIAITVWGIGLSPGNTGHWLNVMVVTTTVVIVVFAVVEWKALRNWEFLKTQHEIDQRLMGIFTGKVNALYNLHQSLDSQNKRLQLWENLNESTWQASGRLFLQDQPDLKALLMVTPKFEIAWSVPFTDPAYIKAFPGASWAAFCEDSSAILNLNQARTSNSVLLGDGRNAVYLLAPLLWKGELFGYSIAAICVEEFLSVPEIDNQSNSYELRVSNYEQLSFEPGVLQHTKGLASQITLPLGDEGWTLELIPTAQFLSLRRSILPNVLLVAGIILAMSMIYINYVRSSFKSRSLAMRSEVEKRTASEKSLRVSQRKLQLILDSSMEGILGLEPNGKIMFANQEACDLTGYSVEELTLLNWQKLCQSGDRNENPLRELKDQKIILIHKTRIDFVAVVSLRWQKNEEDERTFGIVTFQDQTTLLEQEQAIVHYTHELERSNAALKEFAYVASHDLKAPLRGILQLASWIREESIDTLTPQSVSYFELLENRANRLNHLLDDLLQYSKAGNKHGDIHKVNLKQLITNVFELHTQNAKLNLELDLEVKEITTLKVPLEQILRNLISNAAKHHDKPNGTIKVSCHEKNYSYVFEVLDNGPGIPPEHHQRIFKIFQTLKTRDTTESSGMGLAIVKKILDAYQAAIEVESDGKSWTKFTFQWPFEANLRSLTHVS